MSDEGEIWGPWIEHDGKGFPILEGVAYHAVFEDGDEFFAISGSRHIIKTAFGVFIQDLGPGAWCPSWDGNDEYTQVVRYRVRKPRGLTILERIAAEPERHKAPEVVG